MADAKALLAFGCQQHTPVLEAQRMLDRRNRADLIRLGTSTNLDALLNQHHAERLFKVQAARIRKLYGKHGDALAYATGSMPQLDELPDDPVALGYQLAEQFHIVYESKQQLLEADLDDRLEAIADALERELRFLPQPPTTPPTSNEPPWLLN